MKIALGTVQFGLPYGAFNTTGQVHIDEVRQILELAANAGIQLLDTAHAYGSSESTIGEVCAADKFNLVTKIPALSASDPETALPFLFNESLQRLRTDRVYGLLLHRATDLLAASGPCVWKSMEALQKSNRVRRIGVSVYGPQEAQEVIERYPIQLIQLPLNIFDRRHIESGLLALCHDRGIEVHVRSAFLQGFALTQPDQLNGHLLRWQGLLSAFNQRCRDLQITPLQGALRFVLDQAAVQQVVVGVDSTHQLHQIIAAVQCTALPDGWHAGLSCTDLDLTDPSRWQ